MRTFLSYLTFVFLLFFASALQAQVHKGFKMLDRMRYAEALEAFQEKPRNAREEVMAAYGLALLYNEPGFSAFSPDEAYKHYLEAEEKYHELSYEQRKKLDEVSLVLLNNLRRKIEEQAFRMAEAYDNVEDWNLFITTYPKASAKFKGKAQRRRNELLFEQAKKEGTLEAWSRLMSGYGNSLKRYNQELFRQADKALFSAYFTLHDVEDYQAFAKQYPASAFAKPCAETAQEPCLPDLLKQLEEEGDIEGLFDFAAAYPHTSFQRAAVDVLAELLGRRGTEEECKRFVDLYAGYTSAAREVWMRLYERYKFQHPLFEDLREFLRIYPDFPFEEQVISDYLDRQNRMYQEVLLDPSWSNCKAYVRAFPDAPHVNSVYSMLFDLWMLDHQDYEEIEVFAEMFPDYPYADDIERMKHEALLRKVDMVLAEGSPESYRLFLRKYSDKPEAEPVWMALYEYVKTSDDSYRALARFEARYPDFPRMSLLQGDKAERYAREMKAAYEEARKTDKMYAYTGFLQRYPDSPYQSQIESRMAEIAMESSELYFCEQYLEFFPQGAHSKEIKELYVARGGTEQ